MKEFTDTELDNLTVAEFENYLPELFETGGGSISKDPRFAKFFAKYPDCAALVNDLETIAAQAKSLFDPVEEPSDAVWSNIASELKQNPVEPEEPGSVLEPTA